jgi:hypothetical protein
MSYKIASKESSSGGAYIKVEFDNPDVNRSYSVFFLTQ